MNTQSGFTVPVVYLSSGLLYLSINCWHTIHPSQCDRFLPCTVHWIPVKYKRETICPFELNLYIVKTELRSLCLHFPIEATWCNSRFTSQLVNFVFHIRFSTREKQTDIFYCGKLLLKRIIWEEFGGKFGFMIT